MAHDSTAAPDPLPLKSFAAGFAHELRTPLTVIRNSVFYLRHTLPPSPEITETLQMIEGETQAINRVLTRLVELTHDFEPKLETVDLQALANEAINELDGDRSTEWVFDLEPVPFTISCDQERFGHALFNLFKNAIYVMKGGGRVRVFARKIGSEAIIEIGDSGPGIQAELRDSVFNPFVTTKPAGIGLGLTYCRRIVERHGGRLDLKETGPTGTVFVIRLPVASDQE